MSWAPGIQENFCAESKSRYTQRMKANRFQSSLAWFFSGCFLASSPALATEADSKGALELKPVVLAETELYRSEPANNGAGPMWCSGSTCLVRSGDTLFASGLETLKEAKPLNNCRWLLFRNEGGGWKQIVADPSGRTREPSPLAVFSDSRVFMSVNPTQVTDPNRYSGPAQPGILMWRSAEARPDFQQLTPQWTGKPNFTEHSYRSFAADGPGRELILFQNIDYTHAEWAFLNNDGQWAASGKLVWPWGTGYDKPQPIRVCYPNVAIKNRQVHFCGVSDIEEPYQEWRAYKKSLTGQNWDYDFRRLFYTWSKDIARGGFEPWIELASCDKTCGWISPGDLWVGPDDSVHIAWTERALDERLREKFFPTVEQRYSLNYAVVRQGKIISKRILHEAKKGGEVPGVCRFQVAPDNRLFAIYYVSGNRTDGKPVSENRILEIGRTAELRAPTCLPLTKPFTSFFTATGRAGSMPSNTLDILGHRAGESDRISHASLRLF